MNPLDDGLPLVASTCCAHARDASGGKPWWSGRRRFSDPCSGRLATQCRAPRVRS